MGSAINRVAIALKRSRAVVQSPLYGSRDDSIAGLAFLAYCGDHPSIPNCQNMKLMMSARWAFTEA